MEKFQKIKHSYKPVIRGLELKVGEKYPVYGLRMVKTKYGARVVVELDTHALFLPARFSQLTEEDLKQLQSQKLIVISQGKLGANSWDVDLIPNQ